MATGTPTCIYCRATGSSIVFTREHVLQDGFGAFKHALVLKNAVCHDCNQLFSGTVDIALTRGSLEGLERYQWGVKKPPEISKFRYDAVELRAQDLGEFTGARVELFAVGDHLRARPADGAAVRNRDDDEFTHFTVDQILSGAWRNEPVDGSRDVKLFGDDSVVDRMRAALAEQGVTFKKWKPLSIAPDITSVEVGQIFSYTPEVKRGLAKIAFNYLCFRQGPGFVLAPAFDSIRQYIRYGIAPALEPMNSEDEAPFQSSAPDGLRPVVHWIELSSHGSHRNLLGTVMLFGGMRHTIILAADYLGPWFDMPVAHMYNVKQLVVTEVRPRKPR